jgi:hypothetical protein
MDVFIKLRQPNGANVFESIPVLHRVAEKNISVEKILLSGIKLIALDTKLE